MPIIITPSSDNNGERFFFDLLHTILINTVFVVLVAEFTVCTICLFYAPPPPAQVPDTNIPSHVQAISPETISSLPIIIFGRQSTPPLPAITPQTEYYIDSTGTLKIEQLLTPTLQKPLPRFYRADKYLMNLGYQNGYIWLRFHLRRVPTVSEFHTCLDSLKGNELFQSKLETDLQSWVISFGNTTADSVELYLTSNATVFYADTTGFAVPYRRWNISYARRIAFPCPVPVGATVTCFVRVRINGIMLYNTMIEPYQNFIVREQSFIALLWMFYGIVIFALLYNIIAWVVTRNKFYLTYLLYVISLALTISITAGHFHRFNPIAMPTLNGHLYVLTWISSIALGVIFVWTFTQEQPNITIPIFWKYAVYIILTCCIAGISAEMLNYRNIALWILYYVQPILAVPTSLAISFLTWRRGYRPALPLLCARAFTETSMLLNFFGALNIIPFASFLTWIIVAAPALEMMLFGFALADRVSVLERAKKEAEWRREREVAEAGIQTQARERERIFRDIHDGLGANIVEIAAMSEQLYGELSTPEASEEQQHQANAIRQSATDLRVGLREIVWLLNMENDTLEALLAYLRQEVHRLADAAALHFEVEIITPPEKPSLEDITIAPDLRRNIVMAVREASGNIVKHAKARSVWLQMEVENNTLTVSVRDDGKGFNAAEIGRFSNGLKTMQKRMNACGGRFEIERAQGGGTCVRFVVPISASSSHP